MNKKNVWTDVEHPLEMHEDDRGRIADIFYNENIQHVAIIDSKAGVLRGDHYHKETVQHMLMTKGAMEYWHKPVNSSEPAKCEILRVGDIVSTPVNEIHALKIIEDNQFVVFTEGKRGGMDYESDTFRVDPSIIPGVKKVGVKQVYEGQQEEKNVKVHLGCGKRFLPGYIHVDLDKHPHIDHYHDIKKLPMFEDNSVDEIYTCGVFEYFDKITEVPEVLREWRRVLKPGGVLRTAVPDFESVTRVYRDHGDVDGIGILGPVFGRIEIDTDQGEKVLFHKTVYDFNSLKKIMEAAGFTNYRRYDWKQDMPEGYDDYSMAYYPHMDQSGILMSLNVVCEK
jgi:predicted SAM-dependent methyltransferase